MNKRWPIAKGANKKECADFQARSGAREVRWERWGNASFDHLVFASEDQCVRRIAADGRLGGAAQCGPHVRPGDQHAGHGFSVMVRGTQAGGRDLRLSPRAWAFLNGAEEVDSGVRARLTAARPVGVQCSRTGAVRGGVTQEYPFLIPPSCLLEERRAARQHVVRVD